MTLADLIACLLHPPIRTLEQPYTTPVGYWTW